MNKGKFKISDVVWLLHDNSLIVGKVYAIKIEIENVWKKQLHNYKGTNSEIKYYYSYKVVCEFTRWDDNEMTEYFPERVLFKNEIDCIKNIERIK